MQLEIDPHLVLGLQWELDSGLQWEIDSGLLLGLQWDYGD
jgi:hypothetical protein